MGKEASHPRGSLWEWRCSNESKKGKCTKAKVAHMDGTGPGVKDDAEEGIPQRESIDLHTTLHTVVETHYTRMVRGHERNLSHKSELVGSGSQICLSKSLICGTDTVQRVVMAMSLADAKVIVQDKPQMLTSLQGKHASEALGVLGGRAAQRLDSATELVVGDTTPYSCPCPWVTFTILKLCSSG
ncbi:hypothetical protein P7K49_001148 [Saguinus oedipus]|uniref:Uncharacterized protein n=1 Tax=Saguinus oedipus TaxID=9490 RepID=A0ABQ9WDN3_SAGOE|nr:hypothetical protein P7K49_001148 [Saguinus oedipus]